MEKDTFLHKTSNIVIVLIILNVGIWLWLIEMLGTILDIQRITKTNWYIATLHTPEQFNYKYQLTGNGAVLIFSIGKTQPNRIYCRDLPKRDQSFCKSIRENKIKIISADYYFREDYKERHESQHPYQLRLFTYQMENGEIAQQQIEMNPPNTQRNIQQAKITLLKITLVVTLLYGVIWLFIHNTKHKKEDEQELSPESIKATTKLLKYLVLFFVYFIWFWTLIGLLL